MDSSLRKSIANAVRRAKQRIRNLNADEYDEPEGFASGDMKKFLNNPDDYDKEAGGERKEKK